jgi:hypothetical protein
LVLETGIIYQLLNFPVDELIKIFKLPHTHHSLNNDNDKETSFFENLISDGGNSNHRFICIKIIIN